MNCYKQVTMAGDIMKINKIPFMMTISRHIKFGTNEKLENMKKETLVQCIRNIRAVYSMRLGFKITHILMDGQFETLRGDLAEMQITLNTVSNDKHVPEIERYFRTVKERVRCIYNVLPFKQMPGRMITEMVSHSVFWLNMFPPNDGISETMSPHSIITGQSVDYNKHCRLEFGEYAQVHEDHDNSMVTRITGAIAMRPTGNAQGGGGVLLPQPRHREETEPKPLDLTADAGGGHQPSSRSGPPQPNGAVIR
jgi:hypothetical protein